MRFQGEGGFGSSNAFLVIFSRDGSVVWARGVGGRSTLVAAVPWYGFCVDAKGFSPDRMLTPTIYLKTVGGIGGQAARPCAFVTVVGNIGSPNQRAPVASYINVGVTRQPRNCSRHYQVGATDAARAHEPCSGVLRSQGQSGDVWLVKFSLDAGVAEWAKLLGSRDSHEEASAAAATEDGGVVVAMNMISPFSVNAGTGYDTLGLVRSGRPNAPGCRLENTLLQYMDPTLAEQLGVPTPAEGGGTRVPAHMRPAGAGSCLLLAHAPFAQSGLLAKVVDGLVPEEISPTAQDLHAQTGVPVTRAWRLAQHGALLYRGNCSRANDRSLWDERGCNADGVTWVRMLANGRSFFSGQTSRATRLASRPASSRAGVPAVVVGGEFQGFIPSAGGFQPDDLSPDINGGLLNADARDVAAVVMSLLE